MAAKMMEVSVVQTRLLTCAKLQSGYHRQNTNIQFFPGSMPLLAAQSTVKANGGYADSGL